MFATVPTDLSKVVLHVMLVQCCSGKEYVLCIAVVYLHFMHDC